VPDHGKEEQAGLVGVFQALADPTRLTVVERLSVGPASTTELSRPFTMALPSFMKHIRQLERAGLVRTRKQGRTRTCTLDKKALAAADDWLARQRAIWEARADRLEKFVTSEKAKPR